MSMAATFFISEAEEFGTHIIALRPQSFRRQDDRPLAAWKALAAAAKEEQSL